MLGRYSSFANGGFKEGLCSMSECVKIQGAILYTFWDDVPSACSYTCAPTLENRQIASFLKKIYKKNTL
jgi:hypothetical protein